MKKILFTSLLFTLFISKISYALNLGQFIAYPVPFNPRTGSKQLTIDDGAGGPAGTFSVNIKIYDINGDEVFSRNYSSFPVKWNGHNNKGKRVSPGFYILKAIVEDPGGSQGSKIFRILVRY